jgi:hypothetical protein
MPAIFATWSLEKVKEVLTDATDESVDQNQAFIEGDHWQEGEGWIGPTPDVSDPEHGEVMTLIENAFSSENAVLEVVQRHAAGVLGQEPVWGFTPIRALESGERPDEGEQVLIDEIEAALTEWWNDKGVHDVIRHSLEHALWGRNGSLRFYVPRGRLEETTSGASVIKIDRGDMRAALRAIFAEAPFPDSSAVYVDPDSGNEVAITKYVIQNEAGEDEEFYEMVYVEPDTLETIYRTLGPNADSVIPLTLGGYSPVHAISRDPLITPQVVQNQKAMNLAISLVPKNLADAAFLERTFLNARMPGHMEKYTEGGLQKQRWVADDYHTGAGAVNFVNGQEIEKSDGTVDLTTPQLVYRTAPNIDPIFKAREFHYQLILQETRQSHILMNEDGRASGKSREQARVDYNISLNGSKGPAEKVGRNGLQAVVALAEFLAGVPGRYTEKLRSFFECRIDLGPVSQAERMQNNADFREGLLSDETVMSRAGVLDVDKEKAIIASRPEYRVALMTKVMTVLKEARAAGIPVAVAAQLLKLDEEDIRLLESVVEVPPEGQQQLDADGNPVTPPKPSQKPKPPAGNADNEVPAKRDIPRVVA